MVAEKSLATLCQHLEKAEQKLADVNKEFRNVARKANRANNVVSGLREDIALEKLRLWGEKPDLAELMASTMQDTVAFGDAIRGIAASKGFRVGGTWIETNQHILHFSLNRDDIAGIERVENAIHYFAPAMKASKGWVRFAVSTLEEESGSWELRYSKKHGNAKLVRMVAIHDKDTLEFGTLNEALRYGAANLQT